ncbi:MAG: hypothetical protein U0694_22335 [Anaerolineae bacterium]
MKRLLWFYDLLLRLYPPRFREEFGGEMRATFVQLMQEQSGAARVLRLLLELRDFPLSVLREHFAERRSKERLLMLQTNTNPFAYRVYATAISVLLLLTVLCSIVPFYAFGLDRQPVNQIIGGHFDPKGLAFYQSPLGVVMYPLGIILYIATPLFLTAFVPLLLFSMARSWRALTWRWQAYGALLLVAAGSLMVFMFVGSGRLILTWFMD